MFKAAILAAVFAASSLTAFADPAAEALIKTAATELSQGDFTADELRQTLDVERIALFTLGAQARRVDPASRKAFTEAFDAFLLNTFEDNAERFEHAKIEVLGSKERSERDSIVRTGVTQADGNQSNVNWRVMKRDGAWRVVDVQVEGLWLAIEQRAQVSAILGRPRADVQDAIASLKG